MNGRLNLNWLALAIMLAVLPVVELIPLASGITLSMPAPEWLAVAAIAFCFCAARAIATSGRRRLFWAAAALWFALSSGLILHLAPAGGVGLFWETAGPLAGLAVLATLLFRISPRTRNHIAMFGAATGLLLGQAATACLLNLTIRDLPNVYDPVLYRFDAMLGLGFISQAADLLRAHAALRQTVLWIYMLPTIWIILGTASEYLNGDPARPTLMLQFLAATLLGYPLYYLMPAESPIYFFVGLFPDHLPSASAVATHLVPAPAPAFRNAMPSLHTTWLLLVLLALRRSPLWQRAIGAALLAGTILATLGFGEHYAVDLIAALPLVLLVRGTCAAALPLRNPSRWQAILTGTILLSAWILAVRSAPASLAHAWPIQTLSAASLLLPAWLNRRLAVAEARAGVGFTVRKQGQGALPPGPPPRPEALEPGPGR